MENASEEYSFSMEGVDFDGHIARFFYSRYVCLSGHRYQLEIASERIPCPDCALEPIVEAMKEGAPDYPPGGLLS